MELDLKTLVKELYMNRGMSIESIVKNLEITYYRAQKILAEANLVKMNKMFNQGCCSKCKNPIAPEQKSKRRNVCRSCWNKYIKEWKTFRDLKKNATNLVQFKLKNPR